MTREDVTREDCLLGGGRRGRVGLDEVERDGERLGERAGLVGLQVVGGAVGGGSVSGRAQVERGSGEARRRVSAVAE